MPQKLKADSDYLLILVDNNSSTFMTNNVRHFIGTLKPTNNRLVKGNIWVIKVIEERTVKWNIEYDDGHIYSIIIHKVNYVPEAPILLLSPKQWYQQAAENHQKPDGTWCSRKSKNFIPYCN